MNLAPIGHTAASLAMTDGASIVEVRDLLGHSSITTTSRYVHTGTSGRARGAVSVTNRIAVSV